MSETTLPEGLMPHPAVLLPSILHDNPDPKARAEDRAVAALGAVLPERAASIAAMYASLGVPGDGGDEMVILPDETWAFVSAYICPDLIDDGPEIV